MSEQKNTLPDTVAGWIIGIPILLLMLILVSPVILYLVVVKGPVIAFQTKAFLRRNAGKKILCISPGRKFQVFNVTHQSEILSLGIDDVVVFDSTKFVNRYDGFDWGTMISRDDGFPVLVSITVKGLSQRPFKNEFIAFFKKEIDFAQLTECLKKN